MNQSDELADLRLKNEALHLQQHKVTHDLRNPLAAAREFVSLLLDEVPGPINDDQREFLAHALDSCEELNTLLDASLNSIDNNRASNGA